MCLVVSIKEDQGVLPDTPKKKGRERLPGKRHVLFRTTENATGNEPVSQAVFAHLQSVLWTSVLNPLTLAWLGAGLLLSGRRAIPARLSHTPVSSRDQAVFWRMMIPGGPDPEPPDRRKCPHAQPTIFEVD